MNFPLFKKLIWKTMANIAFNRLSKMIFLMIFWVRVKQREIWPFHQEIHVPSFHGHLMKSSYVLSAEQNFIFIRVHVIYFRELSLGLNENQAKRTISKCLWLFFCLFLNTYHRKGFDYSHRKRINGSLAQECTLYQNSTYSFSFNALTFFFVLMDHRHGTILRMLHN